MASYTLIGFNINIFKNLLLQKEYYFIGKHLGQNFSTLKEIFMDRKRSNFNLLELASKYLYFCIRNSFLKSEELMPFLSDFIEQVFD